MLLMWERTVFLLMNISSAISSLLLPWPIRRRTWNSVGVSWSSVFSLSSRPGDGCDVAYQEDAGVGHADVFAAVTGDDDDNLVSCQLAKTAFGVPRAVARVNNPKNEHIFNALGIEAISSTTIIARMIEEESTIGDIRTLATLRRGNMAVVEIELPTDRCVVCDKRVSELKLPVDCVLFAIVRGDDVMTVHGETTLQPGDVIMAFTNVEHEATLKRALTGE